MGLEWHYCCSFDKMKGSPESTSCEHWTGLWHDHSDMRHYQIIKQHWTSSVFVFECPGNGCVTILLQYVGCLCHETPCWLPRLPPPLVSWQSVWIIPTCFSTSLHVESEVFWFHYAYYYFHQSWPWNLGFLSNLVLPPIKILWFHFVLMPITTLNFCYI